MSAKPAKPAPSQKAKHDVTRCLVCNTRFSADDERSNVYKDDKLVGVMHEYCYPLDYLISAALLSVPLVTDQEVEESDNAPGTLEPLSESKKQALIAALQQAARNTTHAL